MDEWVGQDPQAPDFVGRQVILPIDIRNKIGRIAHSVRDGISDPALLIKKKRLTARGVFLSPLERGARLFMFSLRRAGCVVSEHGLHTLKSPLERGLKIRLIMR